MDDVPPPPIPLSQSENWKQIASDSEKRYRDELIRWSGEKTRLLAAIQRLSAERLKDTRVTETTEILKF